MMGIYFSCSLKTMYSFINNGSSLGEFNTSYLKNLYRTHNRIFSGCNFGIGIFVLLWESFLIDNILGIAYFADT